MNRNKTETPYAASRGARAQGCPLIGAHRLVNPDYQGVDGLWRETLARITEAPAVLPLGLRGVVLRPCTISCELANSLSSFLLTERNEVSENFCDNNFENSDTSHPGPDPIRLAIHRRSRTVDHYVPSLVNNLRENEVLDFADIEGLCANFSEANKKSPSWPHLTAV